ncbi:hypothetical protein [Lentibacillus salinarum]|uniref:Uncharacterized protein n=1 Tax=Lentibacillus salinarum TaxID=446820 RepID=A0ABW3ZWU4_9BACI
MLEINAIAALILLFVLIPTAKIVRTLIAGLLDVYDGGDASDHTKGALSSGMRNASFVALAGMKKFGSSGGGADGGKGKQSGNAPSTGGGSNGKAGGPSDENGKGNGGYLPEKRTNESQTRGFAQQRSAETGNSSSIVDKNGQSISSGQRNEGAGNNSHILDKNGRPISSGTGGSAHVGTSNDTGAAGYNATSSGQSNTGSPNPNSSAPHHSQQKPTALSRAKKWTDVGGKIGGVVGKIPSTMVGMGLAIPFGGAAGAMVAKGGTALSKATGKAVGGTAGLAAHGGMKAAKATASGISKIRSGDKSPIKGMEQSANVKNSGTDQNVKKKTLPSMNGTTNNTSTQGKNGNTGVKYTPSNQGLQQTTINKRMDSVQKMQKTNVTEQRKPSSKPVNSGGSTGSKNVKLSEPTRPEKESSTMQSPSSVQPQRNTQRSHFKRE